MKKINVRLRPILTRINLPTVIKTAILPGETSESLFIATQIGEIFTIGNNTARTFLDIRHRVLKLGVAGGGYDERGLVGMAFHPGFPDNRHFYLHFSLAGSQGPGAVPSPVAAGPGLPKFFLPDPCDKKTLNLKWINRDTQYDHIDTVEEWILNPTGPEKLRTLLSIRRPFFNHNGVNSLNFSPETGKLILSTGDGGSGYDPFNLSQDDMEIAGKIIEIDPERNPSFNNTAVVTRFHELPGEVQDMLRVIAKGVRNIPGISFQKTGRKYIKYAGNVGQDLVESIYAFTDYKPIPVRELIQAMLRHGADNGFINFGWRGWEGAFPTSILEDCPENTAAVKLTDAYFHDTLKTLYRLPPVISYFHREPRPDKIGGTALTGVQVYLGNKIPDLQGSVVFTDFAGDELSAPPVRGFLAYSHIKNEGRLHDYSLLKINHDFGNEPAYFVSLGTNSDQSRLYLGVYASMNVNDQKLGTVFEIIPDSI